MVQTLVIVVAFALASLVTHGEGVKAKEVRKTIGHVKKNKAAQTAAAEVKQAKEVRKTIGHVKKNKASQTAAAGAGAAEAVVALSPVNTVATSWATTAVAADQEPTEVQLQAWRDAFGKAYDPDDYVPAPAAAQATEAHSLGRATGNFAKKGFKLLEKAAKTMFNQAWDCGRDVYVTGESKKGTLSKVRVKENEINQEGGVKIGIKTTEDGSNVKYSLVCQQQKLILKQEVFPGEESTCAETEDSKFGPFAWARVIQRQTGDRNFKFVDEFNTLGNAGDPDKFTFEPTQAICDPTYALAEVKKKLSEQMPQKVMLQKELGKKNSSADAFWHLFSKLLQKDPVKGIGMFFQLAGCHFENEWVMAGFREVATLDPERGSAENRFEEAAALIKNIYSSAHANPTDYGDAFRVWCGGVNSSMEVGSPNSAPPGNSSSLVAEIGTTTFNLSDWKGKLAALILGALAFCQLVSLTIAAFGVIPVGIAVWVSSGSLAFSSILMAIWPFLSS